MVLNWTTSYGDVFLCMRGQNIRNTPAVVEEVFRFFTSAEVLIPHCEDTPLQVKVLQYQSEYSEQSK